MLLSVLSFSMINYFIKSLSLLSPYQILFFRSIPALIICITIILKQKISFWGNQKKLLITRSIIATTSVLLYYSSIKYLPIGVAATIRYLAPIFAIFFAIIILKNKFQKVNIITIIFAFIGVTLVGSFSNNVTLIGITLIFMSAITLGASFVLVSKIGTKDSPVVIVFYFSLFSIVVSSFLSIFYWETITKQMAPSLILIGISGFLAQYFLTKAFQTGDPKKIAPIKYFEIIVTMSFGFIFFDEQYSLLSVIGAVILIFSLSVTFLDINKDGKIDKNDLELFYKNLDINDDGNIDFKDFLDYFKRFKIFK